MSPRNHTVLDVQSATHPSSAIQPDLSLWGKWGTAGESSYALLAHLLDSAAVAEVLMDRWLSETLAKRLDVGVASSGATAREIVVAGAGLHDLGKANPVFQGQLLGTRSDVFTGQIERLRNAGYWLPSGFLLHPQKGREREFIARHEIISDMLTRDEFGTDPESFNSVLGGHHGKWRTFGESEFNPDTFPIACAFYDALHGDARWHEQIDTHRFEVLRLLGIHGHFSDFDRSMVPLLTSLVCLSDWIASSEESISHGQSQADLLHENAAEFLARRRTFLDGYAMDILGVPHKPTGSFFEIFGFEPTRPVQRAMVEKSQPGLAVVMVPMGEGKTEAALGHWLSSAAPGQGVYFALPTMATADAMFDRVRSFFAQTADPVLGTLAHGRSVLNAFYQISRHEPELMSDSSGGLTPQDWFTGRHRALLSPVTVGTIDQLLAGTLRHRYNFLRLLGAATKTVILDEVHTYDPYMSELLCVFLEWAGWLKIDVVLLSATLPSRRLGEYLDAYRSGSGQVRVHDIVTSYPSVVRLIDGVLSTVDLSGDLSGRETTVELRWVGAPARKVWETSASAAEAALAEFPGAKIGVILNTVTGAQRAAAALAAAGLPTSLLHARMPANERFRRTEQAISDFGTASTNGAAILVATQVVEASIDLDFDILITEICPAASLLQRSGRVWRHDLADAHRRDRPSGQLAPRVVVVFPEPLPTNSAAFLPYLAAEIVKTYAAFGSGTTARLAIPGDVQLLVDQADVSLEDVTALGTIAEDAVIDEKVKRLRGRESRIPGPSEVTRSLSALEKFTAGELDNEEYATRLSEQMSVTILPISQGKPLSWQGELPIKPNRDQVVELLGYTIPVSGHLAGKVYKALDANDVAFRRGLFAHRLLAEIVVVDLDHTDIMTLDEFQGLLAQ